MIEVIQQIKTAEENAEELKRLARRTGGQIKEDAATEGRAHLDQEAQRASREAAAILDQAEQKAAAYLEQSHKASQALCEELKGSAKTRLGKAADFIVERIVDGL